MKKKLSKDDLRILHRIQAKKNFGHPIYRIDILEYARIKYANKVGGLCIAIETAVKILCGITVYALDIIPKYTKFNVVKLKYCDEGYLKYQNMSRYWWPPYVWAENGRLGFLKWLIEQYRNDKTIMPRKKCYENSN